MKEMADQELAVWYNDNVIYLNNLNNKLKHSL